MDEKELEIVANSIDELRQDLAGISYKAKSDEISNEDWSTEIITLVTAEYIRQWMLGKWSTEINQAEIDIINRVASKQYGYINATSKTLEALTIQEIVRRAGMYANSARQMYWQSLANRYGINLPAYPGDGSSECKSNCKCHWQIEQGTNVILAFWRLGWADHCPTCTGRAARWNPYTIQL